MKQYLNSAVCPIDEKVSLIEASAGTGKTYNIQNLFVRMIMENDFPIESILVVTFTDAATRELKSRIRAILTDISNYFGNRKVTDLERIESLIRNNNLNTETLSNRIEKALREFDKASIFTIHGFCKKSLDENAFATGSYFNQELEKNIAPVVTRIVQNYFRKNFYQNNELEYYLNEYLGITINSCIRFLKNLQNKSNFTFVENTSVNDITTKLNQALTQLKTDFNKDRIIEKLSCKDVSKAPNKFHSERVISLLDTIQKFIDNEFSTNSIKALKNFTFEVITKSLIGDKQFPEDKFFNSVDDIFDVIEHYKISTYQDLYVFFTSELQKEKTSENFRTFNDLINVLASALDQNNALIDQISNNYNAVLIDEFQDTDDLQYTIFHKLFIEKSKPTFLIGDPKQAIYSFRGGDIFAYKQAKEYVEKSSGHYYTLPTNYRSTETMVQSINEFFGSLPHDNKFLSKFIDFEKVDAQQDLQEKLLYKDAPLEKSLKIINGSNFPNIPQKENFTLTSTIAEIIRLLSDNDYQISENGNTRSILPSDIAILVNKRRQADALLPLLQKANITAVVQATGSVYDSEEAIALNLLLKVIDSPSNTKIVRGALTTFIFGVTAETLHKMYNDDSEEMDKWILFFRECQKKWNNGSFIEAFNFIVSETNLKPRLLSQNNGHRKITNLFHLQELIQQKEIDSSMGLSGIVNWFKNQLNEDTREKDNDIELRLETDDDALKIMTIHKSKGLEFPIVFVPFFWSQKIELSDHLTIEYHDDENQRIIDFEKGNIEIAEKENLEEEIRLIYVALTRAKYASYLINTTNDNPNALNYFLKQYDLNNDSEILKALKTKNSAIKSFDDIPNIEFINAEEYDAFTSVYKPLDNSHEEELQKPHFSGNLNVQWHVNSFSSLAKHNLSSRIEEFKDYDEQTTQPENEETADLNIFTFPAGAKVGSCWHEIFEDISFQDEEETIFEIVSEKLVKHGIGNTENLQQYSEITLEMVINVLNCQLSQNDNLYLRDITSDSKIHELEFFFSVQNDVQKSNINRILHQYNIAFEDNIPSGYLTGFIDLVFRWGEKYYIADWKSNAIGTNQADFNPENITMEMQSHQYNLQYLIYTVALYKYLKLRIPDFDYIRDFGGVFYLFLRGVNQHIPASGVFFDLPEQALIEELVEVLS